MELHQTLPVQTIQKGWGGLFHVGQHTQPQRFLAQEHPFPFIEGGRGDAGGFTEGGYGFQMQKIALQDTQDEPQGVRAVRDEAGGYGSVGMAAGTAAVSGDSDAVGDGPSICQFDQVSVITGKLLHTALCAAKRAGSAAAGTKPVQFFLQPLFIRKRYLV